MRTSRRLTLLAAAVLAMATLLTTATLPASALASDADPAMQAFTSAFANRNIWAAITRLGNGTWTENDRNLIRGHPVGKYVIDPAEATMTVTVTYDDGTQGRATNIFSPYCDLICYPDPFCIDPIPELRCRPFPTDPPPPPVTICGNYSGTVTAYTVFGNKFYDWTHYAIFCRRPNQNQGVVTSISNRYDVLEPADCPGCQISTLAGDSRSENLPQPVAFSFMQRNIQQCLPPPIPVCIGAGTPGVRLTVYGSGGGTVERFGP